MNKINKVTKFSLFFLVIVFFLTNCNHSLFGIKGSGETVKKILNLETINKIELAIDADVEIIKGDTQKIEIEGQQNIIDNIKTNVQSGKWLIEFDKKVSNHSKLIVYITLPDIEEIVLSGSGDIYSEDTFDVNNLTLKIPGSGDIDLLFNSENADISISGSGDIYSEGGTINQTISISGSGSYSAFRFFSNKSEIEISGSGDCKVNAQDNLFVTLSGSGNVYYKGNPSVNSVITGSGKVINSN